MINLSVKRRSIYFRGRTTAVSGLAVSRPDDNFARPPVVGIYSGYPDWG